MTGIKNAKGKLKGSDTHSAGLSGTAALVQGTPVSGSLGGGTPNFNQNVPYTLLTGPYNWATTPSITTPAQPCLLIITWIELEPPNGGSSGQLVYLRRGTTNLASFALGGGLNWGIYTSLSPVAGSHQYSFFIDSFHQCSPHNAQINVKFITINDTHAGTLSGSNTQDTQENKIIA